ncbi:MAG: type VI secretion system tip protein VgrG [Sedimentisphaerales bacterium]|nr:type VI secretion system tip protein VgrG [Sedimentisphaerales bacterium]
MPDPQETRSVAISTPIKEQDKDVLLIRRMTGTEELGRLFEYKIELLSKKHDVKYADIIGQNVTIRLNYQIANDDGSAETKERYFNGYVSRFVQTQPVGGYARYEATVVPWLWFMTRTADCRIFQKMKVPDIVSKVLDDHGFTDIDDQNLAGEYREWEYCVQYRETDFNFLSRLMEQEGIYYFFKHENGKHTLVLVDSVASLKAFEGYEEIKYRPVGTTITKGEFIDELVVETKLQPCTYALNDFDFTNTKKDLLTTSSVTREHAHADFEIFDYPGIYTESADGNNYAKARIEELQTQYEIVRASADARGICPGCTFKLKNYKVREDLNREFLITSARYQIESEEFESIGAGSGRGKVFSCMFIANDINEPFRTARLTPKPTIPGPQTAIVVGKEGEEIDPDEYGRVKVQFHWDREGEANENSSCWIRVAQVWAGKGWGAMYIPRIGQEVIVDFLEGDPDRPIITGRVYNKENMPSLTLPDNKTMSYIKSNSTKEAQGFNEIRFEDKKDSEKIFIHAQKDQHIRVQNDCKETIMHDRHLVVTNDKKEDVGNNRSEKIGNDHFEKVGKDRNLTVGGKEAKKVDGSLSLIVGADVNEVFQKNHSEETTEQYSLTADHIVIEGKSQITIKVGGSSIVLGSSGIKLKTGDKNIEIDSGMDLKEKSAMNSTSEAGLDMKLKGGMNLKMEGGLNAELKGTFTKVEGAATTDLKGGLVKIN